nr:hypothetical protein [Tanacetum cinerariifolium]
MRKLLLIPLLLLSVVGNALNDKYLFSKSRQYIPHQSFILAYMSPYTPAALRRHYEQAAANKEAGEQFYNLLHDYKAQDALVLGYKAASEAIKARDASMLNKLTYVQQAMHTFEQAVALDPSFLRFSVESNLPPFLGLSKHVEEDKAFLLTAALQHPRSGLDEEAFRTVRGFLVGRGHVSEAQAQQLAQSGLHLSVRIDSNSGFCFGVIYAIQMAEDLLDEQGYLYCLGDIVHNDEEVQRLEAKGLRIIDYEQLAGLRDEAVLIRAHGEPPSTYQ